MSRLETVSIDRLVPGQYSVRTSEPPKTFLADVKEHGVIDELWVKELENSDKKRIISGGRRFYAAREAGWIKEIECKVYPSNTPESVCHWLSLTENRQREDLTAQEEARAVYEMWKLVDKDTKFLAHELGCSEKIVNDWIHSRQLIEAQAARGKDIDKKLVSVMGYIAGKVPSYKQDETIDAIEGMAPREARKTVKLLLQEMRGGNVNAVAKDVADKVRLSKGQIGGTSLVVVIDDNDLLWAIEQAKAIERETSIARYLLLVAKRDCIAKGIYSPKQEAAQSV